MTDGEAGLSSDSLPLLLPLLLFPAVADLCSSSCLSALLTSDCARTPSARLFRAYR